MKILIAPGAFKNSLSPSQAADAIAAGLARSKLQCTLHYTPIADGGNGTLEVFVRSGARRHAVLTLDPLGREIPSAIAILPYSQTAIIEMALASGIELLADHELDPMRASSYGTGLLINAALQHGVKRVIIGMGGSATVDGGAGCLQALGVGLYDADGRDIAAGGAGLAVLATVDFTTLDPRLRDVEIIIASDVDNPTLGAEGAAAVFAPQKGASAAQVAELEQNLTHFFTTIHDQTGVDVRTMQGGGAAGALSAGLAACLTTKIQSGIDLVLDHQAFDTHLADADLVLTGEGRMDEQTIYGKGPIGVARRAAQHGVRTVAFVGGLAVDDAILHDAEMWAVLPIVPHPAPLADALENAADWLERAALRLGYLLQLGR